MIRRTNSKLNVEIVSDSFSAIGKMLKLDQNGNIAFYRIEVQNGKVIKGELCAF